MNTFIITLWTIVGIFIAGPITIDKSCDDILDHYMYVMAQYGGGSIDFACIEAANDEVPVMVLPDPIP